MMKHTRKHALLIASGLFVVSSLLTGCFDTGYESIEIFYEAFDDDVKFYYTNATGIGFDTTTKSLEDDLYNDDTVNNYDAKSSIEAQYYTYMVVEANKDQIITSISLSIKCEKATALTLDFYVVSPMEGLFDLIRGFGDTKDRDDDEEYSDGAFGVPYGSTIMACKEKEWDTMLIEKWEVNGKGCTQFELHENDLVIVRFKNNTGYGADEGLKPTALTPINIMISPVGAES